MENNQNHIEDIFKEAFANHEMEVSAKVWTGLQSSLAAQSAVSAGSAAASGSALSNAAAMIGIASLVALGTVNEINHSSASKDAVVHEDHSKEIIEQTSPVQNEETASYPQEDVAVVSSEESAIEQSTQEQTPTAIRSKKTNSTVKASDANSNEDKPVASASSKTGEQHVKGAEQPPVKESSSESGSSAADQDGIAAEDESDKVDANEGEASTPPIVEPEKEEEEPVCKVQFSHQAQEYISPDGDNTNECFSAKGAENVSEFRITIWTRGGKEVFSSNDVNFSWCGTDMRGQVLPNRTMCYYKIDAVDADGLIYTESNARGSIMVFSGK